MQSLNKYLPEKPGPTPMVSIAFRVEPTYKDMLDDVADHHELNLTDTIRALIARAHKEIK